MSSDKYGDYEKDPSQWLRNLTQAHWEETKDQAKKPKKTVWALVSMEIEIEEGEEGYDDESLMDIINDELVEYGFIVDDMGIRGKEETK
jgi:hypothetical protein